MPTNWINVISVGPGSAEALTREAQEAIQKASMVFCAPRHARLVPDEKRRPLTPFDQALSALAEEENAAVLVSGDAGLYSLLPLLARRFGREKLRVIPGVSSPQALCARLSLPWQEAKILSAHGRHCPPEALCHAVRTHRQTIVLLDGEHDPHWVSRVLKTGGLEEARLTVGERLSYPDEKIGPYDPAAAYDPLSVALIENAAPRRGLPPLGLSDDQFIRGKTPMTKREIRVQALCALQLPPDAVCWDIGAGTGSVTVEMARQCPLGQVYAVERDEDALNLIRENIQRFHLQNVTVVPGTAPQALSSLPPPTHVFLGGAGGETEGILRLLSGLPNPLRLCATAVTMESAERYTRLLSAFRGFSACQIAVSRLEQAGAYHLLRSQNPVFLFSAETGGAA